MLGTKFLIDSRNLHINILHTEGSRSADNIHAHADNIIYSRRFFPMRAQRLCI